MDPVITLVLYLVVTWHTPGSPFEFTFHRGSGRMMRIPTLRHFAPAAIVLGAAFAWSTTATAQAPSPDGHIAEKQPFMECLDGAEPTTQNVPAVDISGLDEIPHDMVVMDTNPDWDEVVIDFRDDLSEERIVAYTDSMGLDARLNSEFSADSNLYVARVEEGAVPYVKDCLRATAPEGKIKHIEENFEYRIQEFVPDDPLYQYQWNFKQVGAERAWEINSGRDAVVAVIDTGVTVESAPDRGIKVGPDMKDVRTVAGYDFVDDSDFVYDGHGHGTHVAGTIAQATDNGYGVAGLAFEAQIMPIRVLNDQGFGSVADIADAVRFAADNDADVINMSLGGPLPSWVLKRAVDYAHKKGTLVVAAAGNSGKKAPGYPAAYKNAFAVAATQYDQHTTFYSQWGDFVDIAAPGGNTRVDQNGDGRPDGILQETHPRGGKTDQHEFALYMGTSMASPHVAAAAAMVMSAGITQPDKVKQILRDSADDSMREHYSDEEFAQRYGAGLLQVDAAISQATRGQGMTRFGGALALVLLTLIGLRRRDKLAANARDIAVLTGTSATVAAGLFFLPLLLPAGGTLGWLTALVAQPLAYADAAVVGFGSSLNPLLASFLLPLGAYALLAGRRLGRIVASGVAIGMAAFCLTEAFVMTSDVAWIPGLGGVLDSTWLVANGLLSLLIGYLGLKQK